MESARESKRRMEEATTSSTSLLASATEDEIIVAQILLDLKSMIPSLSESLSNSNWGLRRKRSSLEESPRLRRAYPQPSQSPGNRTEEKIKVAPEEKLGRSSDSPDTPLSFSPIVCDEISLKKSSKKRARQREELLDMAETLTRRKELLTRELEKVKKYYEELKALNSLLREKKQDALNSKLTQHHPPSPAHRNSGSQPSGEGAGSVGPRGFDLNIPAEETFTVQVYQPLDVMRAMADKRARFAEARRNRIGIIKTKSNKRTMV